MTRIELAIMLDGPNSGHFSIVPAFLKQAWYLCLEAGVNLRKSTHPPKQHSLLGAFQFTVRNSGHF